MWVHPSDSRGVVQPFSLGLGCVIGPYFPDASSFFHKAVLTFIVLQPTRWPLWDDSTSDYVSELIKFLLLVFLPWRLLTIMQPFIYQLLCAIRSSDEYNETGIATVEPMWSWAGMRASPQLYQCRVGLACGHRPHCTNADLGWHAWL